MTNFGAVVGVGSPGPTVGSAFYSAQPSPEIHFRPRPQPGIDYATALAQWRERIESWDRQQKLIEGWRAHPLPQSGLAVFGGTPFGWDSLATTLGISLLENGRRVSIVDLSRRQPGQQLVATAEAAGLSCEVRQLKSLAELGFSVGDGLVISLARALGSGGSDRQSQMEVLEDRALLDAITKRLRGDVTMARMRAAVRAVLHEDPPPQDARDSLSSLAAPTWATPASSAATTPLTRTEYDDLANLYGSERREGTPLMQRLHRLELHLSRLDSDVADSPAMAGDAEVRLTRIDSSLPDEDFDEVAIGLVDEMLQRWRHTSDLRSESLIVIGASHRQSSRVYETLADCANDKGGFLTIIFDRLRNETIDALGLANMGVAFMQLKDVREATHACEQIGREDEYVLGSTTRTRSSSAERSQANTFTQSMGQSLSHSGIGLFGTTSQGTNSGQSQGTTGTSGQGEGWQVSETRQLLPDRYVVRPPDIQSLADTALYLCGGRPHDAQLLDCHPVAAMEARRRRELPHDGHRALPA